MRSHFPHVCQMMSGAHPVCFLSHLQSPLVQIRFDDSSGHLHEDVVHEQKPNHTSAVITSLIVSVFVCTPSDTVSGTTSTGCSGNMQITQLLDSSRMKIQKMIPNVKAPHATKLNGQSESTCRPSRHADATKTTKDDRRCFTFVEKILK